MPSREDPVTACTFASCPRCSRKVKKIQTAMVHKQNLDKNREMWICASCEWNGTIKGGVKWRYRFRCLISYQGQDAEVVVFGTLMNNTFGCSASDWAEWAPCQNQNTETWQLAKEYFLGEWFMMRLEKDNFMNNLSHNRQLGPKSRQRLSFKATCWKKLKPLSVRQYITHSLSYARNLPPTQLDIGRHSNAGFNTIARGWNSEIPKNYDGQELLDMLYGNHDDSNINEEEEAEKEENHITNQPDEFIGNETTQASIFNDYSLLDDEDEYLQVVLDVLEQTDFAGSVPFSQLSSANLTDSETQKDHVFLHSTEGLTSTISMDYTPNRPSIFQTPKRIPPHSRNRPFVNRSTLQFHRQNMKSPESSSKDIVESIPETPLVIFNKSTPAATRTPNSVYKIPPTPANLLPFRKNRSSTPIKRNLRKFEEVCLIPETPKKPSTAEGNSKSRLFASIPETPQLQYHKIPNTPYRLNPALLSRLKHKQQQQQQKTSDKEAKDDEDDITIPQTQYN